jgi:hypothetical protein
MCMLMGFAAAVATCMFDVFSRVCVPTSIPNVCYLMLYYAVLYHVLHPDVYVDVEAPELSRM